MHVTDRVIRPHVEWLAEAPLPTRFGQFRMMVFRTQEENAFAGSGPRDHVAMVYGDVCDGEAIPVRVHSECLTSEVFGSLKCDCKEQLDYALEMVARRGAGVVIYLRQEGRDIGLANKVKAYALQAHGHDTVDANRALGLPDDARSYAMVPEVLDHLGIRSIALMTNNPDKVSKLEALGVRVAHRLPVIIEPNAHSAGYLETKRHRMAHALPVRPLATTTTRLRLSDQMPTSVRTLPHCDVAAADAE
jgi:GTP cyclohydrolase II